MTTKITAQMSLLLTKKHIRREQNGERLGAISKHSLEHYLVKKNDLLSKVFVPRTRKIRVINVWDCVSVAHNKQFFLTQPTYTTSTNNILGQGQVSKKIVIKSKFKTL